jgi:hypothetical protein
MGSPRIIYLRHAEVAEDSQFIGLLSDLACHELLRLILNWLLVLLTKLLNRRGFSEQSSVDEEFAVVIDNSDTADIDIV